MARHKHPTKKQTTALTLISNGLSPTEAMRKAGYSESTIRIPKQALLKAAGTQAIIQVMQTELMNQGITGLFLADKLAKFAQSENSKEFYGAYDRIAKIVGIEKKEGEPEKKREMVFTEWVDNK